MGGYPGQGQTDDLRLRLFKGLYGLFEPIPLLASVGRRAGGGRLSRAAAYYGFKPEGVAGSAVGTSIVGLAVTTVVLSLIPYQVPLAFMAVLALTVAILLFLHVANFLPSRLDRERRSITAYTPLILHEIYFILSGRGTILDVLSAVGSGGYPYVSNAFRSMLQRTFNGEGPERLLREYLDRQPSEILRRACAGLLFTRGLESETAIAMMDLSKRQVQGYFKGFLRQIEDRLSALFAITFFLPTIVVLVAFGQDIAWVEMLTLWVPAYTLLVDLLYNNMLRARARLVG
ncbi:TPA: hypothetical protein EYP44_02465 [Candidatus Bathyarchaeota archaeon]|nr:hypothetical protein [Candidatus Bathyarchaeota archaeon]